MLGIISQMPTPLTISRRIPASSAASSASWIIWGVGNEAIAYCNSGRTEAASRRLLHNGHKGLAPCPLGVHSPEVCEVLPGRRSCEASEGHICRSYDELDRPLSRDRQGPRKSGTNWQTGAAEKAT